MLPLPTYFFPGQSADGPLHAWLPQAMQAAIGERLLISKADYFVMSRTSGFARQPAVQVHDQQLSSFIWVSHAPKF